MTSTESPSLFEQAMQRYQQGVAPAELIDSFVAITEQSPNQSAGWTCLAWLQLLDEPPPAALRAAKTAVRWKAMDKVKAWLAG